MSYETAHKPPSIDPKYMNRMLALQASRPDLSDLDVFCLVLAEFMDDEIRRDLGFPPPPKIVDVKGKEL